MTGEDDEALRIQHSLGGRYTDLVIFEETGFCDFYRGWDGRCGRPVDITLPKRGSKLLERRVAQGLELWAPLSHANVLPVYDTGPLDEGMYYTTPHSDGSWLSATLERDQRLACEHIASILREVAEALSYCHRHDVLHCDIKPNNILVFDGHVAIRDFAVARRLSYLRDPLLAAGTVIGTPHYMSPEQWQDLYLDVVGEEVVHRSSPRR